MTAPPDKVFQPTVLIVRLSGQSLEITLPQPESTQFPRLPEIKHLDLAASPELDAGEPVYALEKFWDFRMGMLKRIAGTISLTVAVSRRGPQYTSHPDQMIAWIKERIHAGFDRSNEARRAQGLELIAFPATFEQKLVDGRLWIAYCLGGGFDAKVFTTELDNRHMLTMTFRFLDKNLRLKGKWRAAAAGFPERVMQQVRLRV